MVILRWSLIVAIPISVAACASQQVAIDVKRAATFTDAANVKKVAVMAFNGTHGDTVAAKLEASLASAKVNGRPFFDVTSAQARAQQSGLRRSDRVSGFDKETARQLGRTLGVDGVYGGDVIDKGVDTQHYSQTRSEPTNCKGSGFVKKCSGSRNYSVSCVKRTAKVTVSVRLVQVSTGNTPYANTHEGLFQDSGCERANVRSEAELMDLALDSAIEKIRRDVAPSEEKLNVSIQTQPKALEGQHRDQFSKAVDWVKAGDMEKGCQIWEGIEMSGAQDPYLGYNLAICDEADGNIQSAADRARKAKDQASEPDPVLIAADKRYQKLLQENEAVKQQSFPPRQS